MKLLLKNIGLILILAGAAGLIACAFTGHVDNNALLGGCALAVVGGLVAYIVINKKMADDWK